MVSMTRHPFTVQYICSTVSRSQGFLPCSVKHLVIDETVVSFVVLARGDSAKTDPRAGNIIGYPVNMRSRVMLEASIQQ